MFARARRAFDHEVPVKQDMDPHALTSVARTHLGLVRQINEDRILDCPEHGLWAVADGMGGHRGGDVAAEIVIAALREAADRAGGPSVTDIEAALRRANLRIRDHVLSAGGVIGSTVVVLHVQADAACLIWAGDSRGYRLRGNRLEQLTRDHSLVQELLDAGAITNEMAATHPRANVVTRALGVAAELKFDKRSFTLAPQDLLLLCSDGLSRSLQEGPVPRAAETDEQFADRLLQSTLSRDGSDNISFVLVRAPAPASGASPVLRGPHVPS
jgi:serine/threonine protein phosphatase PrpC